MRWGHKYKLICQEKMAQAQSSFHVFRNRTAKLTSLLLDESIRPELYKCLWTLSFVWSLMVFMAERAALRAQYCAFFAFGDYVQKEYINKCLYQFGGAFSRASLPPGPLSLMPIWSSLSILTERRMSTLAEFLIDSIISLAKSQGAILTLSFAVTCFY